MLDPALYPLPTARVELVQTHISYVFLNDTEVYKVKKPVRFSFLDFSSLERRRHFCGEEVRLNRRLAPDTYLGVVSLRADHGGYRLGEADAADAVEYAVRMKRLPGEQMFSEILRRGAAAESHIERIAHRLVEFHGSVDGGPEVAANGSPEALRATMDGDFSECERYRGITIDTADDRNLQEFCRRFVDQHQEVFRARQRGGRIRECHGDMRAEHICFVDGLQFIDCIEFDARFRNRDVAAEVAFLAMDIEHLGRPDLARRLVDVYAGACGDAELPFLVPFYECYFAYIRGKVQSLKSLEAEVAAADRDAAVRDAAAFFAQAGRYTWAYSPALVVVSGLSGSGKTTVAAALHERLGFAHFNSDVVRKEIAGLATGVPAAERDKQWLYSSELNRRTYERLRELARAELEAGRGVIVDATFQRAAHRAVFAELARELALPVLFVECVCDEAEVRRRLVARSRSRTGASDADWEVYVRQRQNYEPFTAAEPHHRVDTLRPAPEIAARVEELLRSRLEV